MDKPEMKMKSGTVQEFQAELLEADQAGIEVIRCLFDQAMEKWKEEPVKLAELAVEMLHCAVLVTDIPLRASVPYGLLFAEANRYANRHFSPLLKKQYHKRLLEYYWTVLEKPEDAD